MKRKFKDNLFKFSWITFKNLIKMNDPLINLKPKGEFQLFIWERHMNKLLSKSIRAQKKDNKELQLKNDELEAEMIEMAIKYKKNEIGQLILKNKRLRGEVWIKDAKLKSYKKEVFDLMRQIMKLQEKINNN
tara:strand:+ start:41 stop:436 length:396 start_codon:yes stop_codon:yes gene_type:complete